MDPQSLVPDSSFQIAYKHFQSIVIQIDDKKTYEKALRQANKKYDIKNFKVLNMTPVKARKIYPTIVQKYICPLNSDIDNILTNNNLGQKINEDSLYGLSFALCSFIKKLSHNSQLYPQSQTSKDLAIFTSIFNKKQQHFLKFQLFALIKKQKKQSKWALEEDKTLKKVLNLNKFKEEQIEWNQVSKEFFHLSQHRFYRSSKQCRQRWMNHLDPNKIKGMWTPQQDLILLKSVQEKGKKWSQISKDLEGCKTQHMVKNRYNSLINKKGKAMGKKNEQKILNRLIEQLQSNEVKNEEEEFKTSSKQGNSFIDNRSQRIKSQRNDEFPNIFENDSILSNCGNGSKKCKFFVQRAGSLSMSERGGILPQLTNPILQEMDSEEQRSRQRFLISTPLSERGGEMKSPSMFLLQENIKVVKEVYNSDFSLSCISNFDKFVPQ